MKRTLRIVGDILPRPAKRLRKSSSNIPYFTFLSQMNPFSVWYLLVLSRGVAIVGDLSRRTAEGLVAFIWLAGVGVQVAIAALDAL